jgi:hypothetical protein
MNDYQIINTTEADLDFVFHLFDEAIIYQRKNNYPDWEGYDKWVFEDDVINNRQFKIISGDAITCIFSVCYADKIIWRERDMNDGIYLHRIAVNPLFKGQQQFAKIFNWAIGHSRSVGRLYIRMDTWANNPVIIDYYKSFGFKLLETYMTPDIPDLPVQNRNILLVLLEFAIDDKNIRS